MNRLLQLVRYGTVSVISTVVSMAVLGARLSPVPVPAVRQSLDAA